MSDSQRELYVNCIEKQLEEINLLSSIYCSAGEMRILDPSVITDFNDFLQSPTAVESLSGILKTCLDFIVQLNISNGKTKEKLEIRIELPHLYPLLENANVIVHSSLLSKPQDNYFKAEIERFIATMDKSETYIFQVISWIQDHIEDVLKRDVSELKSSEITKPEEELVDFERLWIYSHHIKSKAKRQEIIKQSRNLNLSGFMRPGKPGIICVEGLHQNTQDFWRDIKSLHWQKIFVCKSEVRKKAFGKLNELRRFEGFKEQLFCDDVENEESVMNMGLFIAYLEAHHSGYMKKELFGLE